MRRGEEIHSGASDHFQMVFMVSANSTQLALQIEQMPKLVCDNSSVYNASFGKNIYVDQINNQAEKNDPSFGEKVISLTR